jgi:hypothetical protein
VSELDATVTGCRCRPTCQDPCVGFCGLTYVCEACGCTPVRDLDRENYDVDRDDRLLDYLEAA